MATFRHGVYGGNYQAILPDARPVGPGPGAAPSLLVVLDLGQWRLARASRFYYRSLAPDEGVPQAPEPDTWLPFLVRVPFRSYGRNRYLLNTAQDFDAPAPPVEESTVASFTVRLPLRGFGRNPYLWNAAQDLSFVEPRDLPHRLVRIPYKAFGRNPYLWNTAQDESFVAPPEADIFTPFLVRRNIRGVMRVVPAYLVLAPQDVDAPAPPIGTTGDYIILRRRRRTR